MVTDPKTLDEIDAAASKATPGPWREDLRGNWDAIFGEHHCVKASDRGPDDHMQEEANARFVAMLDPTTARALTAELRKYRAALATYAKARDAFVANPGAMYEECEAANGAVLAIGRAILESEGR